MLELVYANTQHQCWRVQKRRTMLLLQHTALNSGFPTSKCYILQVSKNMHTFVCVFAAPGLITDSANNEVTGKAGPKHWDAVTIP